MGDPSPYGEWAERGIREDVGEVTTSLQRPVTSNGRGDAVRHVDSFEIQVAPPSPSNGVPRSAWARAGRRASRWHRPYTLAITPARLRRRGAGQLPGGHRVPEGAGRLPEPAGAVHPRRLRLPAAGLAGRALGQRRLRPPLPGPGHRRVQAGRPRRDHRGGERLLPRLRHGHQPVPPHRGLRAARRPVPHPADPLPGPAGAARRPPPRRHGRAPDGAGRHAARGARGLHGGHPQPGGRPGAGRHPHHRRLRRRAGHRNPGPGVRRAATSWRWSARSAPTRSPSAARPAPSPASCAGWPGSWKAPAST